MVKGYRGGATCGPERLGDLTCCHWRFLAIMRMALGASAISWAMACERVWGGKGRGWLTLRWWSRVPHAAPEGVRLRRRPGPSASARRNHAVRRPISLVWRSPVGITSESTHTSKQRPAAVHHLISRSPAQLQRSLRPALKRAAVNTRQSRAGPRRCDEFTNIRCDRHRPTFLRTRYRVDLTASPSHATACGLGQLPGCLRLHEPVAA